MDDCIFCKIINGQLPGTFLYKDDDVVVIRDIHPQAPVHYLVLSRRHIPEFLEASDAQVANMLKTVKKIIWDEHITSYRIVNNGKGAALIDHLHIHILGSIDKLRTL